MPFDGGQAFQFTAEYQAVIFNGIIKRFLSDSVASQNKPIVIGIPNPNRKHSVQLRKAIGPQILVQVND